MEFRNRIKIPLTLACECFITSRGFKHKTEGSNSSSDKVLLSGMISLSERPSLFGRVTSMV